MESKSDPFSLQTRIEIQQDIEQSGCHLIAINDSNSMPEFVYSIGLFEKFGHPEIIIFGIPVDTAGSIINSICEEIAAGKTFRSGQLYDDVIAKFPCQFLQVHQDYYADYLGYAGWYYDDFNFPAVQLVWPDKAGNFPWEEGFDEDLQFNQALLDRNLDFKFLEHRNAGVYTTQSVLAGAPILKVYHDSEGDWQFHSSDAPDLEDSVFVCFEEITKIDPSINQLFDLQFGYCASRSGVEEDWEIEEIEEE